MPMFMPPEQPMGPLPTQPQQPNLGGLTPEVQAQILALSGQQDQQAMLQQQLAQSQALANQQGPRYTTGAAAGIGGLATGLRAIGGVVGQHRARNEMRRVGAQTQAGRDAYTQQLQALPENDPAARRRLGLLGIAAGDPVTGRAGQALVQDGQFETEFGAKKAAATSKAEADQKKAMADAAESLRKEYMGNAVVKEIQTVKTAYDKLAFAYQNPSAASDIGIVFGIMKMYDPASSVKEGETAMAEQAAGVPGQVLNLYNKLVKGERLTPEARKDFMKQAGGLYQAHVGRYQAVTAPFRSLAERSGLNPEDVIFDFGIRPAPKTATLTPEERKAAEWAKKNPNDPRAQQILQALEAQ